MSQIFQDENHAYQFDFSNAIWATDGLHDIYHKSKLSILSDVDFIVETADSILLIEYKNSCIQNAANSEAFNPSGQKYVEKIARKYYGSWIYITALQKSKPIKYIYILEYPDSDAVTRRKLRNEIMNLLPFQLQTMPDTEISMEMINSFEVLSIAEWNSHKVYRAFPVTQI